MANTSQSSISCLLYVTLYVISELVVSSTAGLGKFSEHDAILSSLSIFTINTVDGLRSPQGLQINCLCTVSQKSWSVFKSIFARFRMPIYSESLSLSSNPSFKKIFSRSVRQPAPLNLNKMNERDYSYKHFLSWIQCIISSSIVLNTFTKRLKRP